MAEKRAVVLLSGGLDSATTLAMARAEGCALYALSFRYGQRHAIELRCAGRLARQCGVTEHRVVPIDLRWIDGSALTSAEPVPKGRSDPEMSVGVPSTYVPARNTIFLSYAVAWAEVLGANDIYIGVNAVDYSGYPDCRAAFIGAFERAANLGTRATVEAQRRLVIHTPLIALSKAAIIQRGLELGVDYSLTSSCYDPDPLPSGAVACGQCDACVLRLRGFAEAGVTDLIAYQGRPPQVLCSECRRPFVWLRAGARAGPKPRRCPPCTLARRTLQWRDAAARQTERRRHRRAGQPAAGAVSAEETQTAPPRTRRA